VDDQPVEFHRRHFLKGIASASTALPFTQGLAAGVAGVAAGTAVAQTATDATPKAAPVLGYTCFSQDEAAFVETIVNIMCPADEFTPNGVDCGLATYIDRQLAGDFGRGLKRYTRGPWLAGKPQQGYQLPLTPEQYFKAGVAAANGACIRKYGHPIDQVKPDEARAFLNDLGAGKVEDAGLALGAWFNDLVYPLFNEACFADPIYGGNYDKVFWKMIGYPGLPATHTVDMAAYRGKPFPGSANPKSIIDFS
jgi:gluconate 2-dehydrogenase gamma chain